LRFLVVVVLDLIVVRDLVYALALLAGFFEDVILVRF
jgi:hypothetical protein